MALHTSDYDPDEEYLTALSHIASTKLPTWQSALQDDASPMMWGSHGPEPGYSMAFDEAHLLELDRACKTFVASELALGDMSASNFNLPLLAGVLRQKRFELHNYHGMIKFTGLDPRNRSRRENIVLFTGIASHLSETFGRQAGNKYIAHLKDLTRSGECRHQILPSPYCNSALPFHTDSASDVLGMFVLSSACSGGRGIFASVPTVCKYLAGLGEDLLGVLQRSDWPFDRPNDRSTFDPRPLMYLDSGEPEMVFSRGALLRSPRNNRPDNIPRLDEDQRRALDAVHFAALRNMHVEPWEPGDMVFFNNRKILHGREAFANSGGQGDAQERHILRIVLRDRHMAGSPAPQLERIWRRIYADPQPSDGTEVEDWPMEPVPS